MNNREKLRQKLRSKTMARIPQQRMQRLRREITHRVQAQLIHDKKLAGRLFLSCSKQMAEDLQQILSRLGMVQDGSWLDLGWFSLAQDGLGLYGVAGCVRG